LRIFEITKNKIVRTLFLSCDISLILRDFEDLRLSRFTQMCISHILKSKTPGELLSRFNNVNSLVETVALLSLTNNQRTSANEVYVIMKRQRDVLTRSFTRMWAQIGKLDYLKCLLRNSTGLSNSARAFIKHELAAWKIYTYCSVRFPTSRKTYYYLSEDETMRPGDNVLVPAGIDNSLTQAQIVKIENFTYDSVPLPLCRTKYIHSKL